MANLAIKGHATRGKEVIELLEMLGGMMKGKLLGTETFCAYYIDSDGSIDYKHYSRFDDAIQFTIEEFFEKFPYKVGDRVRVPEYESEVCISKMYWDGNEVQYEVVTDEVEWYSAKELNKFNEPNRETPRYLNEKANKQAKEIEKLLEPAKEIIENLIKIDIPKRCEFAGVDNQQVVFEKVKPKYPKTYVECAKLLDCFGAAHIDGYKGELLDKFQELLICRDAYWKIAGEQMGLGKSWSPSKNDNVYCIFRLKGEIVKDNFAFGDSLMLEFPTEEMRDAFFENFGHLIEICKELL